MDLRSRGTRHPHKSRSLYRIGGRRAQAIAYANGVGIRNRQCSPGSLCSIATPDNYRVSARGTCSNSVLSNSGTLHRAQSMAHKEDVCVALRRTREVGSVPPLTGFLLYQEEPRLISRQEGSESNFEAGWRS